MSNLTSAKYSTTSLSHESDFLKSFYKDDKQVKSIFSKGYYKGPKTLYTISYSFEDIEKETPRVFFNLLKSIKKSEKILDLQDNWDDKGSESYLYETWKIAILFVFDYAFKIYENHNLLIDTPKIYPSMNGSIDIDWNYPNYGILINISKDVEKAEFYANNKQNQEVRGSFDPSKFNINFLPIASYNSL
jgi:hypothetical protein